ncbi:PqiC family protein [Alkalimarinus coralli]|uniref:PqiC family protein n=1 Tax=Alkalimarinus coralli TaxID=2935863 RepID=UPI00202B848E|nr:PqiC family protein [Alkalimarinus coralli]
MRQVQVIGLVLSLLLMTGCATPTPSAKSEFYLLSSPSLPHRQIDLNADLVVIGPVTIPDYLKRTSIVTLQSDTRYDIAKLEQWGGDLEGEIQMALLKNLSAIDSKKVYVQYSGLASTAEAYNLRIDILRFDAELGGVARLEASWAWLDQGRNVVSAGLYSKTGNAGITMEQAVAAQSELLKQLSQDIFEAL